jgi:hypothetical protein
MKTILTAALAALTLTLAGPAAAALVPSVYDPGHTGCATSTYASGTLQLAKTCATATNAAAQAEVTGLAGQPFSSATFTLASAGQCQGGSPRFNVVTSTGTFFLGCNNVVPTTNAGGTATYTFTAQTLAAAGQQVPTPTGTIQSVQIVLDVQGSAALTRIAVNGVDQVPATAPGPGEHGKHGKDACKHGGWKTMHDPSFRNQGQCVSWFAHRGKHHS